MAELVLGVGTSHSPMVSMGGTDWLTWGQHGDLAHPLLFTEDGTHVTYEERLLSVGDTGEKHLTPDVIADGVARVHAAVEALHRAVTDAELDVLIIVGDDQDEHLLAGNLPPFLVY